MGSADEAGTVRRSTRRGRGQSTYQPSLLSLGFGHARAKRPAAQHATAPPAAKRLRNAPGSDGRGTTTDTSELVPVTREAFLRQYSVEGIADVFYQADWVDAETAQRWHDQLARLDEWYRPRLKVYGREIEQSRRIAAYATLPGLELKYSGHQVQMHAPFPPLLEDIAARLSTEDCLGTNVKFNHAMLNSYADGQVYIGRHNDNIENQVIVTVSLGAPRTWIMEEKRPRGAVEKGRKHRWTLANGSLLVMQGSVQRLYTHEIPREAKVKTSRISITFRQLVY